MNNQARFSAGETTGAAALSLALLFYFSARPLTVIPLFLFLAICLVAPFIPGLGFFLPVISRGSRKGSAISLTFDDGPTSASTPILLKLLARHNLKATFFVIGRQAEQHPQLIQQILTGGHTIGNHSWHHDNLLMFRSIKNLSADIQQTQNVLEKEGVKPLLFRPPVGITGPRLKPVLEELEMYAVNFSCRIYDRGNKEIRNLADKTLQRLRPGDIILLHDSTPAPEAASYWQQQLEKLFKGIADRFQVLPLQELINQPVQETTK